jgi:asparagine synthase (glutamine-hydrolysing)
VQTLLPGHFLEHGEDGTTTRGYWHPPPETQHEVEADWAIERTRSLLQRAVDLRLVADVPVGVFLSGGMDSSAIVTLASRHATEPVHTFTLSFDEAAWDERHFARHVAERFGCKHHDVVLPAQRALQEIDGALAAQDQPSADGMNSYFVSKAARGAGLAVALSGIGADEVFGGYSYFRIFAYAWRARRLLGLLGGGTMARWTSVRHVPQSFRKLISMGGVHPDPGSFYAAIRSMFTAEQVHQIIRSDFRQPATYDDAWVPSQTSLEEGRTDAIQAWSLMELGNYLRNTLLRDTDAMGMAHSLEVREPFLDHLVVEHVTSLPARLKLGRNAKKPHLAAAVPEVPAMVKNRDKMGFTLPFDVWLRGPLRSWAEERLLAAMPQMKCLDRTVVDQMWRRFLSDSSHITQSRIWCLVSLLEWMQRHRIET